MTNQSGEPRFAGNEYADRMDEYLDKKELEILPPHLCPGSPEDFEKYLHMDPDVLANLSGQDLAIIGFRLMQYGFFLQRCINKEKAIIGCLKNRINTMICKNLNNYAGNWDMQRMRAIEDNDVASSYNHRMNASVAKLDRLDGLQNFVKGLVDQCKNLQYSKQKDKNNG